ncbi:hypothetical protein LCGC14_0375470 [marine sediment metagenome]|uniref:Dit-like phage tail protein N-terminal domain-containing protein n=1 Tax=marine sediment metagenome TaxID=412755 RepID=A0A0F9T426_9ZZZZ
MEIFFTKPSGIEALISVDATIEETHNNAALVTEHAVDEGTNISDNVRPENDRYTVTVMITNTPIRQPGSHASGATSAFQPTILFATSPPRRQDGNPILTNPGSPPRTVRDLTKGVSIGAIAAAAGAPAVVGLGITFAGSVKIPGIKPQFTPQPIIPEAAADGPGATVLQFSQEFNRVNEVYEELRKIIATGTFIKIVTSLRTYENMIFENMETPIEATDSVRITLDAVQVRVVSTETVQITEPLQTRGEKSRKRGNKRTTEDKAPERSASAAKKLTDAGIDFVESLFN